MGVGVGVGVGAWVWVHLIVMARIRSENGESIRVLAKRRRPPVSARLRGHEAALLCQPGFVSLFHSLLQLQPLLILLQHTGQHAPG